MGLDCSHEFLARGGGGLEFKWAEEGAAVVVESRRGGIEQWRGRWLAMHRRGAPSRARLIRGGGREEGRRRRSIRDKEGR